MLDAYVLIQTRTGNQAPVAQELAQIPGVVGAVVVAGPYDVVARVTTPDLNRLGELVVGHIQAVDGIVRTLTCPILRL